MSEIQRFAMPYMPDSEDDEGSYVLYTDHIAALEAVRDSMGRLVDYEREATTTTPICQRTGRPHSYWPQGNCQYCGELAPALEANQQVIETLRAALEYIAANDIAYLVAPTPTPKGYPGHFAAIARAALSDNPKGETR